MGVNTTDIWQENRQKAIRRVSYLEKSTAQQRITKIESFASDVLKKETPEDVYLLAHFLLSFRRDLSGRPFMAKALTAISDTSGSSDPEFWRTAYTALCLNDGGYPGWKNLGYKIVQQYPGDVLLLEAYVWDSAKGSKELEQIKYALNRFRSALKPILNKARSVELECWLTLGIFARTRSEGDYKDAKKYMKEYIDHINDSKKQQSMQNRLTAYIKKWG